MTIAHVLSSLEAGGQERVALDLATGLVERGHRVLVVSFEDPAQARMTERFVAAGVEVRHVQKRGGYDLTLVARLAALFRRERVDVVHTHNPLPLIYAPPAARLARAGTVHSKHGRNPSGRGNLLLRQASAQLVDFFVAVSKTTAAQARERRECPPARLLVVTNGVPLGRFQPDAAAGAAVRRELGIPEAAMVVGAVGRVDEVKDHPLLIRAMAPLLGERAHLVIVGDGPYMETVRAAAAAADGGGGNGRARRVHLLGWRTDVERVLSALDVFAMSSKTEGLPLVIPEAMACALPIVSTAVGGIPDVVDEGKTGFLVPAGDESALRARLAGLVGDRPRAKAMGQAARSIALERYSAERMLTDYLGLYEQALARRGR